MKSHQLTKLHAVLDIVGRKSGRSLWIFLRPCSMTESELLTVLYRSKYSYLRMLLREWPRTVGSGMVELGNEAVTVPLEISSRRHLCTRRSATIEFDFEGSVSP